MAPAWGQVALPGFKPPAMSAPTPAPSAPAVSELRAQAEADLEAARQRQEENSIDPGEIPRRQAEKQRLLDVLVFYKNEKLWRLDELAAIQKEKLPSVVEDPLVKALGTKPPYSVIQVDALRDELEAQQEALRFLQSSLQTREEEKQSLQERLRKAAEATRLAADRAARAPVGEGLDSARLEQEIAGLNKQLIEAELSTQAIDQESLRARIALLKPRIDEIKEIVTRILPAQALLPGERERETERFLKTQKALALEIQRGNERHARRLAERQKLLASAGSGSPPPQRLAYLDQALKTDSLVLESLRGLQLLEQTWADAWEQRVLLLSPETPEDARQQALTTLRKTHEELSKATGKRQRIFEARESLRAALTEQEARLARQTPGSPEAAHEKEILDLIRQRSEPYERIGQQVRRLERGLTRWLGDFSTPGEASAQKYALGAWGLVSQTLQGLWDYELFSVEDSTVADGQKITVSYGVTVGKSIGALLLFVLIYGLFSWLIRRLLHFLVRRGLAPQLASVIRRWVMISLGVILVIFVLKLARIPISVFTFVGGALAIGIGFGTQTIIKNFISGIIILFERKIRVGDIIAIGGATGHVTAVDLRATMVKGFDGIETLIPNSTLLENQVVNWTYSSRRLRREIQVQIAYGSPLREAAQLIGACANEHGQVLKDPKPEVYFEDFADSGLSMALVYWIELGGIDSRRVSSDLRFMIDKRLEAAGIGIPFPTREIALKPGQTLPVALVPDPRSPPPDP